jgi:hypothetical protein
MRLTPIPSVGLVGLDPPVDSRDDETLGDNVSVKKHKYNGNILIYNTNFTHL